MKLRLLACTVAFLQIGTAALPTTIAWAQDRGRDRDQQRHHEDTRSRNQSREQQPRAPGQQRYTPPRSYVRDPLHDGVNLQRWDRDYHRDTHNRNRWQQPLPFRHGPRYYAPLGRTRYYRDILVVRPYGHWYSGYGYYYQDNDAWRFLAFTAITLAILNIMSQSQQRALESAQINATSAPIGAPIQWRDGDAYGSVTATRDGNDSNGRYCREFQQQVTVGNRTEDAYGTACRQPDGTWQIVATE